MKHGYEYLDYEIPIISPKEIKSKGVELIIIASMYSNSIYESIKETGITIPILSLFPNVKFVQYKNN